MEVAHARLNIISGIRTFSLRLLEQRQRHVHGHPAGYEGISALTGSEEGGVGWERG